MHTIAMADNINIKNKKARFEYELLETFTAGLQLVGTEIKSIRNGKANIVDGFCAFTEGELYIRNMYIAEYEQAGPFNHEPKRERKLLLNRTELNKIQKKLKDQGITVVPVRLFISASGYAKLDIALAKGKKLYDKRQDVKARDTKRELDRRMKQF